MKRDMQKIANEIRKKVPDQYDLEGDNLILLKDMIVNDFPDGKYAALQMAFYYGFALALRMEKNKKIKRKGVR